MLIPNCVRQDAAARRIWAITKLGIFHIIPTAFSLSAVCIKANDMMQMKVLAINLHSLMYAGYCNNNQASMGKHVVVMKHKGFLYKGMNCLMFEMENSWTII